MFSRILAAERPAVPSDPGGLEAGADQHRAAHQHEPPVQRDHRVDVLGVALAEVVEDLVVDRVELLAELLDLLGAEPRQRALDPLRVDHRSRLFLRRRHVPASPRVFPVAEALDEDLKARSRPGPRARSRRCAPSRPPRRAPRRCAGRGACREQSLPTQVWQMPIRQPNGSSAPASSPATRIGTLPSLSASTSLSVKRMLPPSPPAPSPPMIGWKRSRWSRSSIPSSCQRGSKSSIIPAGPQRKVSRSRQSGQSSSRSPGAILPSPLRVWRSYRRRPSLRESSSRSVRAEDHVVRGRRRVEVDDVVEPVLAVEAAQHRDDRRDPAAGGDEQDPVAAARRGARTGPRRRRARRSRRAAARG